ncbi:acyltransferase family protein [Agromyces ramosus]|uniref:Fucose 4-O-acetylase-like acetyltransferase n=1 Tax=Agromyces ramosus TaxID=33879 RepID=A0ABU0R551_9MICO|nr:acyltransferase [Agromyces ramosus]MDQ0893206.1 fucose 4-O-acetylase-like acetyltransferase [Agromyces ramosus]
MSTLRVPVDRDLSIDFARALCLPVVVLLHALQMGIGGDPLRAFNALDGFEPLAWATWPLMIMPVFFICGGFAAITQWRRLRGHGETVAHYVRLRVIRLARPVVSVTAAVGGVLAVMLAAGADFEFVRTFAVRLAEPLWFIPVYIACTALVPVMSTVHRHAPWAGYLGLAGGVVAVDALSRVTGLPIGPLNWLFVWLFAQQLGFGLRDGWFARCSRATLWAMAAGSYGVIVVLVTVFGYSHDMLDNLNPPTLCILALALGQVSLFALAQPAIRRAMHGRALLGGVYVFGVFGMVIYLWHTFAMAVVVGAQAVLGLPFPAVLSPAWWATRPLWVAAIGVVVALCCLVVPRLEARWPDPVERRTPLVAVVAWMAVAIAGVGVILTQGYVPWQVGVTGCLLVTGAVVALTIGGRGPRAMPEPVLAQSVIARDGDPDPRLVR